MKDNYIKRELSNNGRYEYIIDEAMNIDELLAFYKKLEETGYYDDVEYIVTGVADEYENSKWGFLDADSMINNREFFNKKSLIGVNMLGCKNKVYSNVMSNFNSNTVVVECDDSELLNAVESCFTRQMKM